MSQWYSDSSALAGGSALVVLLDVEEGAEHQAQAVEGPGPGQQLLLGEVLGVGGRGQQVELLPVPGHQVLLHQAAVLLLVLGVGRVGVGRRESRRRTGWSGSSSRALNCGTSWRSICPVVGARG